MTNEERDRRLSELEMDSIDLGIAYVALGDAWRLFGPRIRGTRPDSCEAFFEEWRERRARADAEFDRIEEEVLEANLGITNDGPDRWTSDLDLLATNGIDPQKKGPGQ